MKKTVTLFSILLCITLSILFPAITLSGTKAGLNLWLFTLVPTLLPFLIFTNLLIAIQGDQFIVKILHRPLQFLFPVSPAGTYAICIGALCGYPMGAKAVSDLLAQKKISQSEGQYLLSFCNYPSPMFLIGYVCQICRCYDKISLVLISVYGSAFLSGQLWRFLMHKKEPAPAGSTSGSAAFRFSMLDDAITQSFQTMIKFGGYVMLYSILAAYIKAAYGPVGLRQILSVGFLEITNGIADLSAANLPQHILLPAVCFLSVFGGLSTFSQTSSVLNGSGLSLKTYFLGKLSNGIFAAVICLLLICSFT